MGSLYALTEGVYYSLMARNDAHISVEIGQELPHRVAESHSSMIEIIRGKNIAVSFISTYLPR